jgi:trypsin-like peptidase
VITTQGSEVAGFGHMAVAGNRIVHYHAAAMRVVCIFVGIILPTLLSAQTDAFTDSVEQVKRSIVPVACATWPDADSVTVKQIMGTGFFVNYEGYFITAAHVIKDGFKWYSNNRPSADCFPVVYIPNPAWPNVRWFEFGTCISDDAIDVAVCKTINSPFGIAGLHARRLRLSNKPVPPDGTEIAFTGFPQNIFVPITSRGHVAAVGPFFEAGRIDIVIDKTNWHGVSGGPLYLADGTVIGMMRRRGDGLWTGMGFARDASTIREFLTAHQIRIAEELPAEQKKK